MKLEHAITYLHEKVRASVPLPSNELTQVPVQLKIGMCRIVDYSVSYSRWIPVFGMINRLMNIMHANHTGRTSYK